MALTDKALKAAKQADKNYKLFDEKGLFLLVTKSGAKYWRMKYRYLGKEKLLALGVYPEVSLKKARETRDEARKLLSDGTDPSVAKKEKVLRSEVQNANSFEVVAREWFERVRDEWTESYQARTIHAMTEYLFPYVGRKPIAKLEAPELLNAIQKIEKRGKLETAHRVKGYASKVFQYGIITGRCTRNPANDLTGLLKPRNVKHHAAITEPAQVGQLLVDIDLYSGTYVVKAALKCASLWFCRPGEVRRTLWSEIDFDAKVIVMPGERMKMRNDHLIPLSRQSMDTLESLKGITGRSKYVFPSLRGNSACISENTLNQALRRIGYDKSTMTSHGFRAMARTLLVEELGIDEAWVEHQLAHSVKDANGRAYNRTKFLNHRVKMMQQWADYLDDLEYKARNGLPIVRNFAQE
ncbi:integrase [Marinobacterium aestuarii]|uniref:Integrase n=1 Tax=Marinobacterium aestuarii TaxID=1821621 RepID=A0A1A9EXH4_9GAMM|nr:integrase arm-type DNA-binding domain-containing protein [Marinobacterium aestuarii]ANG62585.1 integrase [Marinobacterium aestuarii]